MARGEYDFSTDPDSLYKIATALNNANMYYAPPMEELFGNLEIDVDLFGRVIISQRSSIPVNHEPDLNSFLAEALRPGSYVSIGEGVSEVPPIDSTRPFNESSPYIGHGRDAIANNRWAQGLPDGKVQELFMGDALLSPDVSIDMIAQMLAQAKRVLDPETGRLVVGQRGFTVRREKLVMLDAMLKHAGFGGRYFVPPERAGEVGNAVGWPADLLSRQMSTHFMIAKPNAETPAPPRRLLRRR